MVTFTIASACQKNSLFFFGSTHMYRLIKQSKSKGKKKALLDQCSLGRSPQCQNITLHQIFQTCTNETSIVFTPLKIKINKICLIRKNGTPLIVLLQKVWKLCRSNSFIHFKNYFQKYSCFGIICSSSDFLDHYPKCLVVFIFHPPAMTVPLSHS